MIFNFFARKGGQGTTVLVSSLAVELMRQQPPDRRVDVIDFAGDVRAALGMPPADPGVDWTSMPAWLEFGHVGVTGPGLFPADAERDVVRDLMRQLEWSVYAREREHPDDIILVDWGRREPTLPGARVLVVSPCYMALRRSTTARFDHLVVQMCGAGRALGERDISHALGHEPEAFIPYDPSVARCVDAGLLTTRVPASLRTALQPLIQTVELVRAG